MNNKAKTPTLENFNPSTCISGKMMRCNRKVANTFRKHISQFDITNSQLSILFVLTKKIELNQKEISDILFLEKSTVNRNIKRLVQSNFILQQGKNKLSITEKGKNKVKEILPHWQKAMDEIREVLSDDGEENLNQLVQKLTQIK